MLSDIAQFPATMMTWKIEREVFLTWKLIFQPFFLPKISRIHHIQLDKLFHDFKKQNKNHFKTRNQLETKHLTKFKFVFLSNFKVKKTPHVNFTHQMKQLDTNIDRFCVQNQC
jgi:hypothetical protein